MNPTKVLSEANIIHPGKTALDVGARDCSTAELLARKGLYVTAVDPDGFPEECKSKNIELIREKIENVTTKMQYDVVVAQLVIHLMDLRLFENLNVLLSFVKKGGVLYFTSFGEDDPWFSSKKELGTSTKELKNFLKEKGEIFYEKDERFTGLTYKGETKKWHVRVFVVKKT